MTRSRSASTTPMLARRTISWPSITSGRASSSAIRRPMVSAPRSPSTPSHRTVNSSPPSRATVSCGRTAARIRTARLAQHVVARAVAEAVVEALEAVEVDEQHGDAALSVATPLERVLEAVVEHRPVRQAREVVVDVPGGRAEPRCACGRSRSGSTARASRRPPRRGRGSPARRPAPPRARASSCRRRRERRSGRRIGPPSAVTARSSARAPDQTRRAGRTTRARRRGGRPRRRRARGARTRSAGARRQAGRGRMPGRTRSRRAARCARGAGRRRPRARRPHTARRCLSDRPKNASPSRCCRPCPA